MGSTRETLVEEFVRRAVTGAAKAVRQELVRRLLSDVECTKEIRLAAAKEIESMQELMDKQQELFESREKFHRRK